MRLYNVVHILVGTPGRVLDLADKGIANLKECTTLIMDEVLVEGSFLCCSRSSCCGTGVRLQDRRGFVEGEQAITPPPYNRGIGCFRRLPSFLLGWLCLESSFSCCPCSRLRS